MKVIKLGGKALAHSSEFENIIRIIQGGVQEDQILVIVSAIGNTTDTLCHMLEQAKNQEAWASEFHAFINRNYHQEADLTDIFSLLQKLYEGVYLLEDYTLKIKDLILAQGELIASRIITAILNKKGLNAVSIDSRQLLVADEQFGNGQIKEDLSRMCTSAWFDQLDKHQIAIITGFIASTENGDTITLGRNGSNYSAALIADFLDATELQNYTHVDGIYTADPESVKHAHRIDEIHYNEASEIANLGASVLHGKTILPLLNKNIPLRILNALKPQSHGTLISSKPTSPGVKSLSVQNDVHLIQLDGRGLLGKVGIDARVFSVLAQADISVGLISQGTSERGLGFIVKSAQASQAYELLKKEFASDFYRQDVNAIHIHPDISVISIIGQDLSTFDKPYASLVKNKIIPILFSNSVTGKNVSLVVRKDQSQKAINVIHGQIFGMAKKINLFIFGHGQVGSALIDQILTSTVTIRQKKGLQLNIVGIANSQKFIFNETGLDSDWQEAIAKSGQPYTIDDVINLSKEHHLENLIAIDNTASAAFVKDYPRLIENGFDLVSSNKSANTLSWSFYSELRHLLKGNHKEYLYETNVGAGLPLIDTIKLLHLSGENITKIKGVFSGSLSYIFNNFSTRNVPFSQILQEAVNLGLTEPNPAEDLSGNDVARKLLVLARELELKNEWEEIDIQNLIPTNFHHLEKVDFFSNLTSLDEHYSKLKQQLKPNHVFRYIGELSGDLQLEKGALKTQLIEVPMNTPLGQLKGSDSIFEIFTESYGDNPIIIQGAGAGASVTARGVFGDILRLSDKK
ncbi:MAG: bifunctional aspartate kinase/homoserine dehydrogenase I [Chitinophagales bacterium]|nr:bifunctional aspartate kinase/homoserine dehydrogenase I [Chitinophagales bacterium]